MRRIYYMNPKRQQIVQEALLQMRSAREALGPEFITRIKVLVKDFDPEYLQEAGAVAEDVSLAGPKTKPWNPGGGIEMPAGMVEIDQKKNLLIIMKYLQLNPDNKSVQKQVRTLLAGKETLQ